jgi:hypothetical protein
METVFRTGTSCCSIGDGAMQLYLEADPSPPTNAMICNGSKRLSEKSELFKALITWNSD